MLSLNSRLVFFTSVLLWRAYGGVPLHCLYKTGDRKQVSCGDDPKNDSKLQPGSFNISKEPFGDTTVDALFVGADASLSQASFAQSFSQVYDRPRGSEESQRSPKPEVRVSSSPKFRGVRPRTRGDLLKDLGLAFLYACIVVALVMTIMMVYMVPKNLARKKPLEYGAKPYEFENENDAAQAKKEDALEETTASQ